MKVTLVPFDHINEVWSRVRKLLAPAVKVTNGRYTTYDVYVALQVQKQNLWIAFDDEGVIHGCIVTEIVDYPSKRCLNALFTAGQNIRAWMEPMVSTLSRFAKDNDCQALEGMGRPEWARLLRRYECDTVATFFERTL